MKLTDPQHLQNHGSQEIPVSRFIPNMILSATLLVAFCFMIGCGGPTAKSYIPKSDLAEEALEKALEQWKSGATYGTIKEGSVPIDVFDVRWQKGKKLESYEILREEPAKGPRTFVVKMKLTDDKEEAEIKYLIVGKNPICIYAEDDFQKSAGM